MVTKAFSTLQESHNHLLERFNTLEKALTGKDIEKINISKELKEGTEIEKDEKEEKGGNTKVENLKEGEGISEFKWDRFNKEVFKVSEKGSRIVGSVCDSGYIITSSTGWDEGIHKWVIDCTEGMCTRQAVGIVTNWEVDTDDNRGFSHKSVGKSYFYKGCVAGTPNVCGIFESENGKHKKRKSADEWEADKIEVCLNCQNWTISFKKNEDSIYSGEIEKGIEYFPALSFCGNGDVKMKTLSTSTQDVLFSFLSSL